MTLSSTIVTGIMTFNSLLCHPCHKAEIFAPLKFMGVLILTSMKSRCYKLCIREEKVEVLDSGNSHEIGFFSSFLFFFPFFSPLIGDFILQFW